MMPFFQRRVLNPDVGPQKHERAPGALRNKEAVVYFEARHICDSLARVDMIKFETASTFTCICTHRPLKISSPHFYVLKLMGLTYVHNEIRILWVSSRRPLASKVSRLCHARAVSLASRLGPGFRFQ